MSEFVWQQQENIIVYKLICYVAGYDGENPVKTLQKVSQSTKIMMDRWKIEFSKPEEGEEEEEGDPIPCNIINNYFSIGVVSTQLTQLSFFDESLYILCMGENSCCPLFSGCIYRSQIPSNERKTSWKIQ